MRSWTETYRITLILLRYKFLATKSQFLWSFNKKQGKKRTATRAKRRIGSLVTVIMFLFFTLGILTNSASYISRMSESRSIDRHFRSLDLGEDCGTKECLAIRAELIQPVPVWNKLPHLHWLGIMIFIVLVSLSAAFMPLYKLNNQTEDRQLEWIACFPVKLRSFLLGRILSEATLNFLFWFFVAPCVLMLLYLRQGVSLSLISPGLVFCASLAVMSTSFGLASEMWIKARINPKKQRMIRAILVLVANPLFLFAYMGLTSRIPFFWNLIVEHYKFLSNSLPNQVLIRLFHENGPSLIALGTLIAFAIGLVWVTLYFMEGLVKRGLYSHSGYESFRGAKISNHGPIGIRGASRFYGRLERFIPTMVWREFIILSRDLNYIVQSVGLPLIIIGVQFVSYSSLKDTSMSTGMQLTWVLGIPFLLLMGSTLSLVSREHKALWLLCSAPRKLTSLLAQRQLLWLTLAYGTYIAVAALVFRSSVPLTAELCYRLFLGALAIWMYENLCRSLGLFFHNPFSVQAGQRVSVASSYIALSLSGIICSAVGFGSLWTASVAMTLMMGLTLAFRQKALEYEPYILDPSALPPARASLSDGLIAALIYFVIQSLVLVFGNIFEWFAPHNALLWSSLIGAVSSYVGIQSYYSIKKAANIPVYLGPVGLREIPIIASLLLGLLGIAKIWMQFAGHWNIWQWIDPDAYSSMQVHAKANLSLSLVVFAGLVAPLIEEFIFRGLIFAGMKRLLGMWPAVVVSSLLFAALHPPLSFVPVFMLGASAAFLYNRNGILLPSVTLHILYNLGILMIA
jgi:ABC-2 type transport system permease protein